MALKFDLMIVVATIGLLAALGILHGVRDEMPGETVVLIPDTASRGSFTMPKEIPQNFSIRYSFGVEEKNVVDTSKNMYMKDMVCDPSQDYEIVLDAEDLNKIYEALLENDLFSIKEDLTQNCDALGQCVEVTPLSSVTLTVSINANKKTVKWRANYYNQNDPDVAKFREIQSTIEEIISEKEEELEIPEPRCAYL